MSTSISNFAVGDKEPNTCCTELEDLSPIGYRMSEEDLKLVSGGRKLPARDDATGGFNGPTSWD
jgi:hypothetical protein